MTASAIPMDLKDLSDLSARLNASTDELNQHLKTIEDRINDLSLGVEAWVTRNPLQQEFSSEWAALTRNAVLSTPLGQPVRERTASELGYSRFPDGWRLAIRTVTYRQTKAHAGSVIWEDPTDREDGNVEISRDAKPLLRASRTIRILAVDRIPALIESLYISASRIVDAVEKARQIADSLNSADQPGPAAVERKADGSDDTSAAALKGRKVLWVDDNPHRHAHERATLEYFGVQFSLATTTDEAMRLLALEPVDAVISDMRRGPDTSAGYKLLDKVRAVRPDVPFIVYSPTLEPGHRDDLKARGAFDQTNEPGALFTLVASALSAVR
jgi:CheY-like chemotaxis protein